MQQARWRDECAVRHAQRALQASVLGRWGWRLRRRRAGLSCQLAVVAVCAQRLRRRHTMRGGLERLRAAARRHEAGVRAARRRLGAAALARLLRGWAVAAEMARERREAEEERRGLAAAERVQLGVRARCWGGWLAFVEARRFEHEARSRTDELWSKARRRLQHVAPCRPTTTPCIMQACSTRAPPVRSGCRPVCPGQRLARGARQRRCLAATPASASASASSGSSRDGEQCQGRQQCRGRQPRAARCAALCR